MEPVTHFLTGACLGRSGLNRRAAYTTLAMTLAAEAPDLDMFWKLRGPVAEFQHHRGITHTLLGAPFVALAVTLFCYGVHRLRKRPPRVQPHWIRLWIYACLAAFSHLLLDFTNSYGIRPFAPFQTRWYSWDIVFILEPLMLLLLTGALIMPGLLGLADREMRSRPQHSGPPQLRGRGWAIAALLGVAALYTVRATEHARAMHLLQQTTLDQPLVRVAAEPFPTNPFHWKGILETENAYHMADVDTRADSVDTDATRDVLYKAAVTPAVAAAKQSWLGRVYLDWSVFPLVEDTGPGAPPDARNDADSHLDQVNFSDVRFGYSGWLGPRILTTPDGRRPLSGSVFIAPNGQVEATYFNGNPQN